MTRDNTLYFFTAAHTHQSCKGRQREMRPRNKQVEHLFCPPTELEGSQIAPNNLCKRNDSLRRVCLRARRATREFCISGHVKGQSGIWSKLAVSLLVLVYHTRLGPGTSAKPACQQPDTALSLLALVRVFVVCHDLRNLLELESRVS